MGHYCIRVLTIFAIACCLALQSVEATADKNPKFGFGYILTASSNRDMMSSNGFSWKTPLSKNFSVQNVLWFLEDEKAGVGVASRFLYTFEIHPRSQFYSGWGINYRTPWWFETLIGFEYFFSDTADFGYILELGVSRLQLESEDSETDNKLGARLLFGYHFYF